MRRFPFSGYAEPRRHCKYFRDKSDAPTLSLHLLLSLRIAAERVDPGKAHADKTWYAQAFWLAIPRIQSVKIATLCNPRPSNESVRSIPSRLGNHTCALSRVSKFCLNTGSWWKLRAAFRVRNFNSNNLNILKISDDI
jgi:hypothetical protein